MGIRSFLAFDLPAEMKKIVSRTSQEMRKYPLEVRWVNPDSIHLTMVFLGKVPLTSVSRIGEAAGSVCSAYGPFQISLNGVGVFPGRRRPRVLWIGLAGDLTRLSAFREAIQKSLVPFGIEEEAREFKPHLTLGRFRRTETSERALEETLAKYVDLRGPVCSFYELTLFKSDLRPQGAVYTKLGSWPLSGRG